jgi:hypothetical protein
MPWWDADEQALGALLSYETLQRDPNAEDVYERTTMHFGGVDGVAAGPERRGRVRAHGDALWRGRRRSWVPSWRHVLTHPPASRREGARGRRSEGELEQRPESRDSTRRRSGEGQRTPSLASPCWYDMASEKCVRTREETGDGGDQYTDKRDFLEVA